MSDYLINLFAKKGIRDAHLFDEPEAAVIRICEIYDQGVAIMQTAFDRFTLGDNDDETGRPIDACYPFLGVKIDAATLNLDARLSYGALHDPGLYGTTLTRPSLFQDYYRRQIELLMNHHGVPVVVGISKQRMPLPFVIEESTADIRQDRVATLQAGFPLPDMSRIDDAIANGTHRQEQGMPKPLALFTAERVDYSLQRFHHYTATRPEHVQRFVLLTNYQRYVEHFIDYARKEVSFGDSYHSLVEPGEVITHNRNFSTDEPSGAHPRHLPQMPAYHLTRPDRMGITMVNIGVGPSNAKTITDHLAVLRPHCWLMLGHCAGLRRSQQLGDYVLAHGYAREDHVLDQDLPLYVTVPPIAEVQVALQEAVLNITGLKGRDIKTRMRTGTVASTDNRNWELRYDELYERLNRQRAIAVDMESATIAANGFRFRVPYGTLLCVSDKPLHGELKLRGMANTFYRERIDQHLQIGLEAIRILRDEFGPEQIHSRKLRSFDEPAFR
ncbi:MAG: AMP nucleosidase [Geminicoccaceae bacterium]